MNKSLILLLIWIIPLGCVKREISNEDVIFDVLPQIVEQNVGPIGESHYKKIIVGIDEDLLIIDPFDIETIKSIKSILGRYFEDKLPGMDSIPYLEAINNLINQEHFKPKTIRIPNLSMNRNLEIIHNNEIERLYPKEKLDSSKIELGRHLRISNVYLNKSQTEGFLVYDYYCGDNCGQGNLVFLKKKGNNWTIIEQEVLWVS